MEPQYNTRATRGFTPREATDFLMEATEEDLRMTPDEYEALRTLMTAAGAAMHGRRGVRDKLRIYINRGLNITPNKRAAHAVHAALEAFGVHPGVKVIVLDAGPTKIEEMRVSIRDAGHTELEPGTLTAGTNWPEDSEA